MAIAPAGDVNGDGRDDVLIGAHGADPLLRSDAGAAYVLYGGSGPSRSTSRSSARAASGSRAHRQANGSGERWRSPAT